MTTARRIDPRLPDLAVLKPDRRRGVPLAADALLVIEVADPSLAYDCDTKLPRFARSGIPEVWLVDVAGATLVRHRAPEGDRYRDRDEPDPTERLAPEGLRSAAIDLSGLFITDFPD